MCFALNKAFPRHVFDFPPCEMSAVLGFANENLGKLVQVILQVCRKPSHMKIGSFGTEIGVVRPSRKRRKKKSRTSRHLLARRVARNRVAVGCEGSGRQPDWMWPTCSEGTWGLRDSMPSWPAVVPGRSYYHSRWMTSGAYAGVFGGARLHRRRRCFAHCKDPLYHTPWKEEEGANGPAFL